MKLCERIRIAEDDEVLYIGAKSGWLYIGTKKRAEKNLRSADKETLKLYLNMIKNSTKRRDKTLKLLAQLMARRERYVRQNKQRMLKKIDLEILDINKSLTGMTESIENTQKIVKAWTPMLERTVEDMYYIPEYVDGEGGSAVIISGEGCSKWWTKREFDSGVIDE